MTYLSWENKDAYTVSNSVMFNFPQKMVIFRYINSNKSNYLVFSLGGRRLFKTQSRHHQGKSLSSSVPSKSVIFFLHGLPWEPSVIMDGGEIVENSNGGYTTESFSALPSTSTLEWVRLLALISFADKTSPLTVACDPSLSFLLANQWASRPLRVSRAKLTCGSQVNAINNSVKFSKQIPIF